MPVPTVAITTDGSPRPAPWTYSPHAAASASFSMIDGNADARLQVGAERPVVPARQVRRVADPVALARSGRPRWPPRRRRPSRRASSASRRSEADQVGDGVERLVIAGARAAASAGARRRARRRGRPRPAASCPPGRRRSSLAFAPWPRLYHPFASVYTRLFLTLSVRHSYKCRNGMKLLIGILTSGGDAPGMNAVVAGACDEAERLGGRALGVRAGFAGLASARAEPVTALQAHEHAGEPGTWLGTSRWPQLREPEGRAACRRGDRGARTRPASSSSAATAPTKGARALADVVPVAVVPATIDRDLHGRDLTIGMDSAIAYAVDAIDRLRVTGRSLPGRAFLRADARRAERLPRRRRRRRRRHRRRPRARASLRPRRARRAPARAGGRRLGRSRSCRRPSATRSASPRTRRAQRAARPPDDPRPRPARRAPVRRSTAPSA